MIQNILGWVIFAIVILVFIRNIFCIRLETDKKTGNLIFWWTNPFTREIKLITIFRRN